LGPVLNSGGMAEPETSSGGKRGEGEHRPSKVGFTRIYIDDGCTWTRKGGDHPEDLARVLKLLKIANTALKMKNVCGAPMKLSSAGLRCDVAED